VFFLKGSNENSVSRVQLGNHVDKGFHDRTDFQVNIEFLVGKTLQKLHQGGKTFTLAHIHSCKLCCSKVRDQAWSPGNTQKIGIVGDHNLTIFAHVDISF
jgi:hypothetical protein